MSYFASIDQGTTSSRFIVFDEKGKVVAQHQEEFPQYLPDNVSVEHSPEEIWISVENCINEVLKKVKKEEIQSIGITNQRETTVAWSKSSGESLCNAIVWQDTRTQKICDDIEQKKELETEFNSTGLPISTYFSLSKIIWMMENVEAVQTALPKGDVCFGTVDSWLLFKLTNKFFTDVTNASRTLMYDINKLDWNDTILESFNIPRSALAEVRPSLSLFGNCVGNLEGVPITAVLGDQQASLFGQNCIDKGGVKNTYGTGCFALTNTGNEVIQSKNGLLSTIAYQYGDHKPFYALEGSVAIAGAAVQWVRDNLGLIKESSEIESLAIESEDNGDVYFVPAFSGLFSPHWDQSARGVIVGLSRFANKNHIARAVLESVAYQSYELLKSMEDDLGLKFEEVKVDGGIIENNLLMQFQADILDKKIIAQPINEITAFGAAAAGYISVNNFEISDLSKFFTEAKTWSSKMDSGTRERYINKWFLAIEKSKNWIE